MVGSVSYLACYSIRCSSDQSKINSGHVYGTSSTKISVAHSSVATPTENEHISKQQIRQNIPTKKQIVDHNRQGLIIEEGAVYRQTFVIPSYEIGADKTATLESILNLLYETALNHVWMSGLLSDGFGAMHGMRRNTLIWSSPECICKGEVLELDTWVGASGKNGMRRDWQLRSKATGLVFARATRYVKYVRWMLEAIPDHFLEEHQLSSIVLEYKRECRSSDTVESLCHPDEGGMLSHGVLNSGVDSLINGISLRSEILEGNGLLGSSSERPHNFTHLLQTKGESTNEEIVRGRTTWKKKLSKFPT